ncbi:MAG TPA: hypothetical protein PLO23_05140 [Alphaproteobacteria bacterium]|nr:hypothetical protein [Alphaproteobacteria bacterium]
MNSSPFANSRSLGNLNEFLGKVALASGPAMSNAPAPDAEPSMA